MQTTSLEIRYQSAGVVPPPYAHFYTLQLHINPDRTLRTDFSITYTDREELDEEEITGEGFTLQDDYQWAGTLPAVWTGQLEQLLAKTRLRPFNEDALGENDDYFVLKTEKPQGSGSGALASGVPTPVREWRYLVQELIQAIYEVSKKEKPFEFTYVDNRSGQSQKLRLTASFGRREIRLDGPRLDGPGLDGPKQSKTLPWSDLQPLMETLYAVEYLPEEAVAQPTPRGGHFLNLGEAEWYEFEKAIIGPESALKNLQKALARLVSL